MLNVPSQQADAALALKTAVDNHLEAVRSGDRKSIEVATTAYIIAEKNRLILSDPRSIAV